MQHRNLTIALALLLGLAAPHALAQERDPAAAQALYDEGLSLMQAGRYDEACPKLAESQKLDPALGTRFHLGDCYEHQGKVASAWALFLEVSSLARASNQPERDEAATARARRLEPRLPKLRIVVPEAKRVPGLEVHRDETVAGSAQWGVPLPVDPGPHRIVVSAPGHASVTKEVTTREAEILDFEIPELSVAADAGEPAPPPTGGKTEAKSGSSATPWIIGLGAAGVVGVGVGTVFGLMAKSKNDDSKAHCRPDDTNLCDQQGVDLRDDARKNGNVSTIAFAVGGAALVGAGVVWLVAGSSSKGTDTGLRLGVQVSSSGGGVSLASKF